MLSLVLSLCHKGSTDEGVSIGFFLLEAMTTQERQWGRLPILAAGSANTCIGSVDKYDNRYVYILQTHTWYLLQSMY